MTYAELLLHIQQQEEKVLTNGLTQVITDKHLYLRQNNQWQVDLTPGAPEKKYGREGVYYVWKQA